MSTQHTVGEALKAVVDAVGHRNFVVLDTETTGLREGEVCQSAIVDPDSKVLLNTLVHPIRGIPEDATAIHGITDADVQDAPGWVDVAPRVATLLQGKDVIAYNAIYDRMMMHKSTEAAGIAKIDWKTFSTWFCAMEAYAEYHGEWNDYFGSYKWVKLVDAARGLSIQVDGLHTALDDALLTLEIVRRLNVLHQ